MMSFITVPVTVSVVFFGVYKLFELFVCKGERLRIIEKLGAADESQTFKLPSYQLSGLSFSALRWGLLMIGIGAGLLCAFFLCLFAFPNYGGESHSSSYSLLEVSGIVYGACTLLFGGVGLIIAFLLEQRLCKKS